MPTSEASSLQEKSKYSSCRICRCHYQRSSFKSPLRRSPERAENCTRDMEKRTNQGARIIDGHIDRFKCGQGRFSLSSTL